MFGICPDMLMVKKAENDKGEQKEQEQGRIADVSEAELDPARAELPIACRGFASHLPPVSLLFPATASNLRFKITLLFLRGLQSTVRRMQDDQPGITDSTQLPAIDHASTALEDLLQISRFIIRRTS